MEFKNFCRSLLLTIIFAVTVLNFCTALSIKKLIRRQIGDHLRPRRQAGGGFGHFFAQNVSFGLGAPAPGTENGPWGRWTESSECSRPCGGGIAFQDRICRDVRTDGRHSCVGASRRYYTCNIQDCSETSKDFREEQCSRFNTIAYEGKYYGWLPYYKAQNPCELNCMPKGERFYTRHARKVIDGTRCYEDGSLDVCIDGVCMPVGCDMMLGSTAQEDECRECGGDGSSCRIIKGIFDKDNFEVGYNDILLIPSGATSIYIKELQPTNNYFAVRNLAGDFYLNGNWRIEFPREIRFAGTLFHYERKPHGSLAPESLRARGPTTEPIFIVLLYQETNLGVSYEYSIPVGVSTARPDSYSWTFGDFEECSQTCGGGVQYRPVHCIRNSDRDIVAEGLCDPSLRPAVNATCNTQPCPARWQIGDWSNCSHSCGGGSQFRLVFCHQMKDGDVAILVAEEMCREQKPLFMRMCNIDTECPQWFEGEWSECNKSCGPGHKTREIECHNKGDNSTVDNSLCNLELEPVELEECSLGPCEGVEWILSDWSGCDGLCSPRMESREAHCANENGAVFPDEACEVSRLPDLTRLCPVSSMCEPMWHTSEWTECSVTCGNGVQSRVVFCGVWEANSVIKIDESKCIAEKRFIDMQNCSSTSCEGIWFTGPWNRCSVPCGGGEKTRKVLCFHEDNVVETSHCDPNERPFDEENCNNTPCDGDEVMVFGGCKDLKYGCCPDGVTPAGFNYEGCQKMNISSNSTCEEAEFGCCVDEFTLALGPFKKGCPTISTCNTTKFGCCSDDVTAAQGPEGEGCLEFSNCTNTSFGCCFDGITPASDENFGGCEEPIEQQVCPDNSLDCLSIESSGEDCTATKFGCCPDDLTPAAGPNNDGCDEELITVIPENCSASIFGCYQDIISAENDTECKVIKPLGLTSEIIPDSNINATSELENFEAINVRLNSSTGWCGNAESNSVIYVDLGHTVIVKGFLVKGVTTEEIVGKPTQIRMFFKAPGEDGLRLLFPDFVLSSKENDSEELSVISLHPSIHATFVGLQITSYEKNPCMKFELLGCEESKPPCTDSSMEDCFIDEGSGDGEEFTNCNATSFGCCPDNVTVAEGIDNEGCPEIVDCTNTTYGCCEDNVTAAKGPDFNGCTDVLCSDSPFGCCPDNITVALGLDNLGCENTSLACNETEYGCCPDNTTTALGLDNLGCENTSLACNETEFGCCPDNTTTALGLDNVGCENTSLACNETEFGCCPDNTTTALGLDNLGCENTSLVCNETEYGCCPDNMTTALGLDNLGCVNTSLACNETEYGCCPDNVTMAVGLDGEGCDIADDCMNTTYGCCPDNATSAIGKDGEGCECANLMFGCCPDNVTFAKGLDNEGCNLTKSECANTTFGCCLDNVTVSEGLDYEGCPNVTNCTLTEFGCCVDGISVASGLDFEGCVDADTLTEAPPVTTITPEEEDTTAECANTLFGCCPDMKTLALGPNLEGCCFGLKFGCCPDNLTAALGPTFLGCSCHTYPYGCCPDGATPAQGHKYYGCNCHHFRYGCCQDDFTPATGPQFEGCHCKEMRFGCCADGITPMKDEKGEGCGCSSTRYGCCPDGKMAATSADLSGCPCDTLPYGCCPDGRTPARTSDLRDCSCDRQRFGCCLDGRTPALGPNYDGCPCDSSRFGCCFDGKTPAQGHNFEGCPCEATQYGCCVDGYTHAKGPNFQGCPAVERPEPRISADVCSLSKDAGPCRNYTVKWFFDVVYGGCSRFWYGGCNGNGNVFSTQEQCEQTCVTPEGADACLLPKVSGPCEGKYPSWHYDVGSKTCEYFTYSGCLGNNNRFTSKDLCEHTCIMQEPMEPVDVCTLAKDEGPCNRAIIQWHFNSAARRCEQFYYGGCEGNSNRFETRANCEQSCLPSTGIETDICRLPQEMGSCYNFRERWYYDYELGQCHRFYYSGCDGNDNNFASFYECEKRCSKDAASVTVPWQEEFRIEFCSLEQDSGPCTNTKLQWYYDKSDGVCKEFYYGGCQGNGNRFQNKKDCEASCESSQDTCRLPVVKGPCSGSFTQWYYNHTSDECYEFVFSGCQGNANRFNNRETCQSQCRKRSEPTEVPTALDDVCSLPQEPGPCLGYYRLWYYDSTENICKSFVYGGCSGNDNRFEKRTECEQRCFKKGAAKVPTVVFPEKPKASNDGNNEDVCRLAVEPGSCSETHARWFYDAQSQSCLPFVYGGCGGNKNRFKTPEICLRFCTGIKATSEDQQPPYVPQPITTTTTTTTEQAVTCPPSNCGTIQCPFGIEESFDDAGCSTCRCSNPCEAHSCPEGSRCSIDIAHDPQGGTRTEPVCRRMKKLGECPTRPADDFNMKPVSPRDCDDRCRDDADCRGDHKCCNNGCAFVCMQPEDVNIPSTQPAPARILPGPNMTKGRIGEPSELPCNAIGYPKPSVTWWREATMLPLSSRRYEQRSDYTLVIRSVVYEDTGDYSCQAHNGIGPGATFTVTLVIDVYSPPVPNSSSHSSFSRTQNSPPYQPDQGHLLSRELPNPHNPQEDNAPREENVPLSASVTQVNTEPTTGLTLQIDCDVQGPEPGLKVTWHFKGEKLHSHGRREILSNHTLLVTKAELSDSGEYTCTAKHGHSVASSSISLTVADSSSEPSCVDSPQFANCELIVKARYCNNKYYGRYCCASCKKAGQIHHWPLD